MRTIEEINKAIVNNREQLESSRRYFALRAIKATAVMEEASFSELKRLESELGKAVQARQGLKVSSMRDTNIVDNPVTVVAQNAERLLKESQDREREQGIHAHNLRMVVSQQVDTLRAQYFSTHHRARDLRHILTQERTPMGFDVYEIKSMLEKLSVIQ